MKTPVPSIIWHPHESGAVHEGVAPIDALCPGTGELREWAAGLKTRPGASTGPPSPLREPNGGTILGSKDLLPHILVALKSRLNTVVNVGQPACLFREADCAYTVVSYSSSSWEAPMLRYCKRGVAGDEYSSARMVFLSLRSIK